jgi:hypothetical protein
MRRKQLVTTMYGSNKCFVMPCSRLINLLVVFFHPHGIQALHFTLQELKEVGEFSKPRVTRNKTFSVAAHNHQQEVD